MSEGAAQPAPAPPFALEVILQGYALYRLLLLLTYAGFLVVGAWGVFGSELPEQASSMGLVIGGIALLFGGAAVGSFFLRTREPWVWRYHAAMLALGVPLCTTTPFALAVGWTWLHPGVKACYGILPESFPDESEEGAEESPKDGS